MAKTNQCFRYVGCAQTPKTARTLPKSLLVATWGLFVIPVIQVKAIDKWASLQLNNFDEGLHLSQRLHTKPLYPISVMESRPVTNQKWSNLHACLQKVSNTDIRFKYHDLNSAFTPLKDIWRLCNGPCSSENVKSTTEYLLSATEYLGILTAVSSKHGHQVHVPRDKLTFWWITWGTVNSHCTLTVECALVLT